MDNSQQSGRNELNAEYKRKMIGEFSDLTISEESVSNDAIKPFVRVILLIKLGSNSLFVEIRNPIIVFRNSLEKSYPKEGVKICKTLLRK